MIDNPKRLELVQLFMLQPNTDRKVRIEDEYLADVLNRSEFYNEAKQYLIDKGINLEEEML